MWCILRHPFQSSFSIFVSFWSDSWWKRAQRSMQSLLNFIVKLVFPICNKVVFSWLYHFAVTSQRKLGLKLCLPALFPKVDYYFQMFLCETSLNIPHINIPISHIAVRKSLNHLEFYQETQVKQYRQGIPALQEQRQNYWRFPDPCSL